MNRMQSTMMNNCLPVSISLPLERPSGRALLIWISLQPRISILATSFVVAFCFSTPAFVMERSYSAPEISFAPRMAVVAIPVVAALARTLTQWTQAPDQTFTTRAPTNRGVFLVTNEIDNENTIAAIRNLPRRGDIGIGVSALFNLELFLARAHAGVTHWLMIDPAPEVQAFWQEFIRVLEESEDLNTVIEQLERALSQNSNRFFTPDFLTLNGIFDRDHFRKWLHLNLMEAKARLARAMQGMNFSQMKDLFLTGIILFPSDLADPNDVQSLETYVRVHHHELDTLYASNVFMHLPQNATETFRALINLLRGLSAGEAPAYLVEALPRREGELARITGTPIQKIYDQYLDGMNQ